MRIFTLRGALATVTLSLIVVFVTSFTSAGLAHRDLLFALLITLCLLLFILQLRYERREQPCPLTPEQSPIKHRQPVILVLGPYASRWFSKSNYSDSVRYTDKICWLLVTSPQMLTQRINSIKVNHSDSPLMAFFPFLPDGFDTSEIMIDKITSWKNQFAGTQPVITLPCILGIYARLTTTRRSHLPENASWSGKIDATLPAPATVVATLKQQQEKLAEEAISVNTIQRFALLSSLLRWMANLSINAALEKVFTQSPLQLHQILLCDDGNGFPRHGAWSRWLEEHYGILPPLGIASSLPPLPEVRVPVLLPPPPEQTALTIRHPLPKILWSILLATLLLAIDMAHITWSSAAKQQQFQKQLQPYNNFQRMSVLRKQHYITQLALIREQKEECSAKSGLTDWWFSPCARQIVSVDQQLASLKAILTYSTDFPPALFNPGSAKLKQDAIVQLTSILTLIRHYPNQFVLIIGHTDNSGSDGRNATLSEQRAIAVRDWLAASGVNTNIMSVRGVGASEPVASNKTVDGRARNRRVDVLILPLHSKSSEIFH